MFYHKLSYFDFNFNPELIAKYPAYPRGSSRLLYSRRGDMCAQDLLFSDLPTLLRAGDLLVFNDSKVLPASLTGSILRNDSVRKIIIKLNLIKHVTDFINQEEDAMFWEVLARPAKKINYLDTINFDNGVKASFIERRGDFWLLKFHCSEKKFFAEHINAIGKMPIPPYLRREAEETDIDDYQTIYANRVGSVAAPTAGLHFTNEMLKTMTEIGVEICFIELEVGGGTFLPIRSENIDDHQMHYEKFSIKMDACNAINAARYRKSRIIAIGTTALRALESACAIQGNGMLNPVETNTNLFIKPGFQFRLVDAIITNFHLPKSSLFILMCAFGGYERMHELYRMAIKNKYRFFSYGDSSFIER